VTEATNSLDAIAKWLDDAQDSALRAIGDSHRTRSHSARERHLVALHYELLRPMLGISCTTVYSGEIPNPWPRRPHCPIETKTVGIALSVGVNYRTAFASNARVSAYGFAIDPVEAFLSNALAADTPSAREARTNLRANLKEHGSRFFTEMIDLYFAIFGRSNTLNEFFLDTYKGISGLDNVAGEDSTVVFSVEYHGAETSLPGDERDTRLPLEVTAGGDLLRMSVSTSISDALTGRVLDDQCRKLCGGRAADAGGLAAEFWRIAWETFYESIEDESNGRLRSRCSTDWVPAALRRMSIRISPTVPSLVERLNLTREFAERVLLCDDHGVGKQILALYPDILPPVPNPGDGEPEAVAKTEYSLTDKIRRLLRMLQGNLCLVPWARKDDIPLPIVILPVIGMCSPAEPGMFLACSWTFVLSEHSVVQAPMWQPLHARARQLFGEMFVPPPEPTETEMTGLWPWSSDIDTHKDTLLGLFRPCTVHRRKFTSLIEACKLLTGKMHESHPVSFAFVYGDPEVLKGIDYAVSNETHRGNTHLRVTGDEMLDGSTPPDAAQLCLQCDGHYAIFQRAGIAGYIDRIHGRDCVMDKIVSLRSPSDIETAQLRARGILEDEFVLLRTLTAQYSRHAVGVVAGGDGRLRLFVGGRMVLVWRKEVSPDEKHWKLGLELSGESRLNRLREQIALALAVDGENGVLTDLVATICTVSETPGEGALLIFDPRDEDEPALCDMVPDDFKMEWARTRRLNGLEQRLLRSLMTMDGAVHISRYSDGHMVRARRFIAASPLAEYHAVQCEAVERKCPARSPAGAPEKCSQGPFDATCLMSYLRMWEAVASCAERALRQEGMQVEDANRQSQIERVRQAAWAMRKWQRRIGTKGTRHRSVFQFVVLSEQRIGAGSVSSAPLICSISADGPVHLYRLERCLYWREGRCAMSCNATGKGDCIYLWAEEIVG